MKFDNIELADGVSGARDGQGMKRVSTHYIANSHYGLGVGTGGDLNEDYYVVWNEWPTTTGTLGNHSNTVTSTALAGIGISALTVRCKDTAVTGTLDCAIVRKSDRKAVRIQLSSGTIADYEDGIVAEATITAIDPKEGPRTPETGRLINLGYA
tara:strand:+ start:388 stop:849 length:462 start_codon:yes stop_codon:yes gene_type:complete